MEETELHERLRRLAENSAPQVRDPDEFAHDIAGAVRTRRRQKWTVAAVAAVLVAVLVGVPALRSGPDRDVQPAGPTHSSGVYSTPTRGNLAKDAEFVDALRRLPWAGGPAGTPGLEPPLDSRHVVFAGIVPGGKWALVAGTAPGVPVPPDDDADGLPDLDRLDSFAVAWFTGPSGASAEEMSLQTAPRVVDADEPTALLSPTARHFSPRLSITVVVAAPDDRIELSFHRAIGPDGEITRQFEPVSSSDGIAAVQVGQVDASVDRALRYRVVRGAADFTGLPETFTDPNFIPPSVDLARPRPAPAPAPGDAAVEAAIDDLLGRMGVWADIMDFTVLWAGDLPTSDGAGARLTVLAAVIEDGAVYVTGALGWGSGGRVATTFCGSEIRPAGTPPGRMIVVLRCDGTSAAPTDSLVVVAPPGTGTARALDGPGRPLGEFPLTDGVAVVPVPAGLATVEVVGPDGGTVDRRAPMGTVDFGD